MRGFPFFGQAEPNKTASIFLNSTNVAGITVRTACTPVFDTILLVRRGNAAAVKQLHGFYQQNNATFPENTGDVHGLVNGIRFDGRDFVYHRFDQLTNDIIFRPLVTTTETTVADVQEGQEVTDPTGAQERDDINLHAAAERLKNEGGKPQLLEHMLATDDPEGHQEVKTSGGTLESKLLADERRAVEALESEGGRSQTAETYPIGGDTPSDTEVTAALDTGH